MDQQKIGSFLKALRTEKAITQELLAERLMVSNRSVSRWENGATMPDFDLLLQLAAYYGVGIEEILDGERKKGSAEKQEQTILKVADYNSATQMAFSKKLFRVFLAGLAAFAVYMVMESLGLEDTALYSKIADVMLGIVLGSLLVGALYSSRYITKIKDAKARLLRHWMS